MVFHHNMLIHVSCQCRLSVEYVNCPIYSFWPKSLRHFLISSSVQTSDAKAVLSCPRMSFESKLDRCSGMLVGADANSTFCLKLPNANDITYEFGNIVYFSDHLSCPINLHPDVPFLVDRQPSFTIPLNVSHHEAYEPLLISGHVVAAPGLQISHLFFYAIFHEP